MRPSMSAILLAAAKTLGEDVAPRLSSHPYAAGHAGTIGLLLVFLAQESDRAAQTLSTDISALSELFADLSAMPFSAEVKAALERLAARAPADLRVSTLEAHLAELNAVLIDAHAAAETSDAPWAREAEAAIWARLTAQADARALYLPVL